VSTTPIAATTTAYASRPLLIDQVEDLLKLQKAAQQISSILDLDQLVDTVVNDVARSFGCIDADIYLHHEERGELVLASACGCDGCDAHGPGHSLKIGKEGMVGHVAATGKMRYAPDVRVDPYYIGCEEATLSEVAIPLHVEGQLVGVFTTSHHQLDAFPPEQIRLLQALCNDVAVAVHNARRFRSEQHRRQEMSREAQEARAIQQALLPKASPYIPGFAVSAFSISAGAVGGDWYDFIPMDEGRWALVLADVAHPVHEETVGDRQSAQVDRIAVRAALAGIQRHPGNIAQGVLQKSEVLLLQFLFIDGVDRLGNVGVGVNRGARHLDAG